MADISIIRSGRPLTTTQLLRLTASLSWPAMLAQLSSILMQYIDAAMVGRLGADDSAAVGLVSTSLWLFWGICSAVTVGFSVQVAHSIGAADYTRARDILRQSITACLIFSIIIAAIGAAISPSLPHWLGGTPTVAPKASTYFLVFVAALPMLTLNYLGAAMLRCVGNMKIAGTLNILMCILDVIFNALLIFPTHTIQILNTHLTIPGANLGILGAALGTVAAETITALTMMGYLTLRQPHMTILRIPGSYRPRPTVLRNALRISAPMTLEHAVICGAQIAITIIVAPLGVIAIAANAFAITAESLCYMPGYGIGDAATTLVGQSHGARHPDLARRFGHITVLLGIAVMTIMGILMYLAAPAVMALMTPLHDIATLGAHVLRIEAFAEPMFAAAIVSYGVMIGVGDTLIPACLNFGSIWLIRLPLAAWLAPTMGLPGVWTAMAIELTIRGILFLWRLLSARWLPKPTPTP